MLLIPSIASILSIGVMVLGASSASGQPYPNKPIRIVTAPPGGGADFVTRVIAQGISGPLGQSVVTDNRPTAVIGAFVAKAPADGYTLCLVGQSFWISPLIEKMSYDPISDFSPITLTNRDPQVLVVHPSLPVKSVKELIALAKARPGELNYAGAGLASTSTLAAELFKAMAGVDIANVNFSGVVPALTSVLSGEVQMRFSSFGAQAPHVKSGKLRALAVTSALPSALALGLPTIAASGLPGYVSEVMQAILAPAKTPDAVINRLNQEIVRYLTRAEVKEQLLNGGSDPASSSPEELAAAIRADMAVTTKLIKGTGISR
jgi:tripartite-type tricarboxylate transporter receptor subunit TctC